MVGVVFVWWDFIIVLIFGDGGGFMVIVDLELVVCVVVGCGMVVVWNDVVYGVEVNFYGFKGFVEGLMCIFEVDFVVFGVVVGVEGVVVWIFVDFDCLVIWVVEDVVICWFLFFDLCILGDVIVLY